MLKIDLDSLVGGSLWQESCGRDVLSEEKTVCSLSRLLTFLSFYRSARFPDFLPSYLIICLPAFQTKKLPQLLTFGQYYMEEIYIKENKQNIVMLKFI